jgi:hypothetical protein
MSGLHMVMQDRRGPMFTTKSVMNSIATEIEDPAGTFLTRGAKIMSVDINNAARVLNEAEKNLMTASDRYQEKSTHLSQIAKKCSGDVRKAADDLASGLAKVEKTANFGNLERYVNLLERAAIAMQTLAELEKSGKLDKIAGALK